MWTTRSSENAAAAGLGIAEYSKTYETAFFEDLEALGIERPEILARATECIPEMVTLVERLAEKEFAYRGGGWLVVLPGSAR